MEKIIENIEYNTSIAKVTLSKVIDRYGVAAEIFSALGQHGINVELISTSSAGRKRADISFATLESDLDDVIRILEGIKSKFGAEEVMVDKDCALITISGAKLATAPGFAGKVFAKLSEQGINLEMISTSLSILSIVVKREKLMAAVVAIKDAFAITKN